MPDDLENTAQVNQKRQKHEAGEEEEESPGGVAVRNTGSMPTCAGTNGVDKSFSAGSCGETGVIATSEIPFRNASVPDAGHR